MPFKKGESGNPNGRPPGTFSLRRLLKDYLEANPKEAAAVIRKTVIDAKKGDTAARKLIFDQVDGTAPQSIDLTSGGEQITNVVIVEIPTNGRDEPDSAT